MAHTFTNEIEIRETNLHQEPDIKAGDKYIDDYGCFCIVNSVTFVKYVWEDISQWIISITAYSRNELSADEISSFYAKKEDKKKGKKKR